MSEELAKKYLNEANTALQAKELDKALSLFEHVAEQDPNNAEAHTRLAELYSEKGLKEKAANEYHLLGNAYYESRLFKNALKFFQKVFELDPVAIDSRIKAAEIYVTQEMEREAKLEYLAIAEYFMSSGDLSRAEEFAKKAVELKSIEAYYILGLVCFKRAMWKEAATEFEKLVKIKLNHAGAWTHLSIAYSYLNKINEALSAAEKVIKIDPSEPDCQRAAGLAHAKKGEIDKAIPFYVAAIDETLQRAEIEKILEVSSEAVTMLSGSPDIMFKRGEALEAAGLGKQAAEVFSTASELYKKANAQDSAAIAIERARADENLVPKANPAKEPAGKECECKEGPAEISHASINKMPTVAVPKKTSPAASVPVASEEDKKEPLILEIDGKAKTASSPAAKAADAKNEGSIIERTAPAAKAKPGPAWDAIIDSLRKDASIIHAAPAAALRPATAVSPDTVQRTPVESVEELFKLADKHIKDHFYEKAIEICRIVLKKEPRNIDVRAKLHQAYLLLAQQEEDISNVQDTKDESPDGDGPDKKRSKIAYL